MAEDERRSLIRAAERLKAAGLPCPTGLQCVEDPSIGCDPQTSGGLLVSCAPQAVDHVLDVFKRHGFAHASEIGAMHERSPSGADAALVVD